MILITSGKFQVTVATVGNWRYELSFQLFDVGMTFHLNPLFLSLSIILVY
jgi:hypothetical protein